MGGGGASLFLFLYLPLSPTRTFTPVIIILTLHPRLVKTLFFHHINTLNAQLSIFKTKPNTVKINSTMTWNHTCVGRVNLSVNPLLPLMHSWRNQTMYVILRHLEYAWNWHLHLYYDCWHESRRHYELLLQLWFILRACWCYLCF